MKYNMSLRSEPFEKIRCGTKDIELRLLDWKRRRLKVGDIIEFACLDEPAFPLFTKVLALHRFGSFAELYRSLPLERCGYTAEEIAAGKALPSDMDQYYPQEEQKRCGVVGIELELLPDRENPLLRASRFLSLVLRHKPEAAGITLDEHGWANVEALLQGMRERHPISKEELEAIVRFDEKQRYSFSGDQTLIRANQGHSVPVDVELQERTPPKRLFHGSGEKYAASIEAQGLLPKSRLYVHLSLDVETAMTVGARHGKPVVYEIDAEKMSADGYRFYRAANGVWLTKRVPPQYLKRT